jgi:hypothetical protein
MPLVRMNCNAACPDCVLAMNDVYNLPTSFIKQHKLLERHPDLPTLPIPAKIITQADLRKGERVRKFEMGRPDPLDVPENDGGEAEDLLRDGGEDS